jgi:hypothetical protein
MLGGTGQGGYSGMLGGLGSMGYPTMGMPQSGGISPFALQPASLQPLSQNLYSEANQPSQPTQTQQSPRVALKLLVQAIANKKALISWVSTNMQGCAVGIDGELLADAKEGTIRTESLDSGSHGIDLICDSSLGDHFDTVNITIP